MPLIYIVGEGEQRLHVIHAELMKPRAYSIDNLVYLDSDIDRFLLDETISHDLEDRLYWSRSLMKSAVSDLYYPSVQKGLSITFCGHTIGNNIRQVLSHVNRRDR